MYYIICLYVLSGLMHIVIFKQYKLRFKSTKNNINSKVYTQLELTSNNI